MSTDLYAYRPGLIFLSPNAGLQVVLWPERYYIYPDGSREMTQPVGFADFELGLPPPAEFVPEDEEGNPVTTSPVLGMETYGSMDNIRADIRGGAFDLDYAAEYYQWTDEQRDMAARKLLRMAHDKRDRFVTLFEPKAPERPWPTYDSMKNYLEIAKLADDLGLLEEALIYERRTKQRPGIIEAMEARRRDHVAEEALTAQ